MIRKTYEFINSVQQNQYKIVIPYPVKIRWFALNIWSNKHEIILQDRRERLWRMQVVSFFFALYKKIHNFWKWKVCPTPYSFTRFSHAEHSIPHFHTKHRLNRLPHEHINTWLPLATLGVHTLKLPLRRDPFQKWHFTIMRRSSAWLEGG